MPAVVRRGDTNAPHCSGHTMEEGSTGWFVDGAGMVGTGHSCTGHLLPPNVPPCPPHKPVAGPPDRGWYVDGKLIAAFGDTIPDCTAHAQGSPNWFISYPYHTRETMYADIVYLVQHRTATTPEFEWITDHEYTNLESAIQQARHESEEAPEGTAIYRVVERPTGIERYTRGFIN